MIDAPLPTNRASDPRFGRLHEREPVQGMVPQTLARLLAEHLVNHGVDPARHLPPELRCAATPQLGRVRAEAFCQALLRSAEALDDPLLGLHLGRSLQLHHLGAMGYLLLSCENLGAALARIQRYHRLLHDINPISHRIDGEDLVMQWGVSRGRPGALFDEMGITAIVQCARALAGGTLPIKAIDFVNPPPPDPAPFRVFYGGEVNWRQPITRLVLPLSSLQTPLRQPDPVLRSLMEAQVDATLAHLPDTGDLADMTRHVVALRARHGMPELEDVAAELRLSPRVFYRRLAAQGLNFRRLREEALRHVAERHLSDARLSLADVSELLGYAEQSAFSRAFKRWSGMSPLRWRQLSRAAQGG